MKVSFLRRPNAARSILVAVCLLFWGRVLFTGNVLLPGAMLRGFAPFGNDATAPWTILQWDSLAQYFPWRHFAAEKLRVGEIPLWNPYQFCGTPFLANAQSAVFYPLNFPFWFLGTAYAFGVSAFLHSLLASFSTYFLAKRWKLSTAAAILAAIAYSFCGYLSAWALLPTLFATASWLPLCLLLLEKASDDEKPGASTFLLTASLWCALLAGHAQIFFYIVLALLLRQIFLRRKWRGLGLILATGAFSFLLGSIQLIPTLELAKLGHRAGLPPTPADWDFWKLRALHGADLPSLLIPGWPTAWGTLNENFGYVGMGMLALAVLGLFYRKPTENSEAAKKSALPTFISDLFRNYALSLALFSLLYALATPVSQFFFFGIPGVSQMGGSGRAFLLWSLGLALLAGFGLDFGRSKIKSSIVPLIAILMVSAELFSNAFSTQPTAPQSQIYPETELTTFLTKNTSPTARVLMVTPKGDWLPTEAFGQSGRTHPPGILPPNGATVYGIYDVNGYDSLSPKAYRSWIGSEEKGGPSPQLNGNMVLMNNLSPNMLDSLGVRYVVTLQSAPPATPPGTKVLSVNDCDVWQRDISGDMRVSGAAFYPGWKEGQYQPETFRFGGFISLCALGFLIAGLTYKKYEANVTKRSLDELTTLKMEGAKDNSQQTPI